MWKFASFSLVLILWVFSSSLTEADFNEFDDFEKPVICGQNLTSTTGGFKLNQPNLTEGVCYWHITPKNVTAIYLFIHSLFLDVGDVVTLHKTFEDALNDSSPLVEPLTAQTESVTVITEETEIVIKMKGTPSSYLRKFDGFYQNQKCAIPLPADVRVVVFPIHSAATVKSIECIYTHNKDVHEGIPLFTFEAFHLTNSNLKLDQSTADGTYSKDVPPVDFFPKEDHKTLTITVNVDLTSTTDKFRLKQQLVNPNCSSYTDLSAPLTLTSPNKTLNNGSIIPECRWLVHHQNQILGITFNKMEFDNVLDLVAINDGGSELSSPLLQVTTSNRNFSSVQLVRTSGPYMWIAFSPISFASNFSATVTIHDKGRYFKGNGNFSVTGSEEKDVVFLLEVDNTQIVSLQIENSNLGLPATLQIFDGFDTSILLTTIHDSIPYLILSKTSKMMVAVTKFDKKSFSAKFEGITPGCNHMSTLLTDSYVLSGNCNSTCSWIIPPQDTPNNMLLLDLQYIALNAEEKIEIFQLDKASTSLGIVTAGMNHMPQLSVEASVGALVKIHRGMTCKADDIALVGHTSYIPACGKDISPSVSTQFQVTSPSYPNTYPLLAGCSWKIAVSKENLLHLAFDKFQLAPHHCVKIVSSEKNNTFTGNQLPEDIFVKSETVVQFHSSSCDGAVIPIQALQSAEGFSLNGTVADCGDLFVGKTSGEFNTSLSANKTTCIWKISVPEKSGDSVNIITYNMIKKDDLKNYDLHVYDGASVRDAEITNVTGNNEIWSRTNQVIITYKRIDVTKPASVFVFKYQTKSCNKSMQCANGLCMHPDWRCNLENDCGDFTDERNCASVPHQVGDVGYSGATLGTSIFFSILIGLLVGAAPYVYGRYKNGQYHRFSDISVIE